MRMLMAPGVSAAENETRFRIPAAEPMENAGEDRRIRRNSLNWLRAALMAAQSGCNAGSASSGLS